MAFRPHLLIVLSAVLGGLIAAPLAVLLTTRQTAQSSPDETGIDPPRAVDMRSFAAAVDRAAPSVVNIFSSKMTTERQAMAFRDPLLQRLYGHRLPETSRRQLETSLGSGVVVSDQGYVLTNSHIVKDADEIKVLLADGSNASVEVIGSDPETDLAILKLSSGEAPPIPIGRPEELHVGDIVLAIGNPFGVGQTVTMGIVGATGRSRLGISAIENFIQTDAAINPGNSGGALVNTRGELVGINTAIFSNSGGSHGVGFAIPANLAQSVLDEVLRKGRVIRGWIGVAARNNNAGVAKSFGLRTTEGVLVSATVADSPAEAAGLRPGDVITEINGSPIRSTNDLQGAIARVGPSADLSIQGWRGSERLSLSATTTERTPAGN